MTATQPASEPRSIAGTVQLLSRREIFGETTFDLVAYRETFRRPVPPQARDCVTLAFILAGSCIKTTRAERILTRAGDLVVSDAGVWCAYEPQEPVSVIHVHVGRELLREEFGWLSRCEVIAHLVAPDSLALRGSPVRVELGMSVMDRLTPDLESMVEETARSPLSPGRALALTSRFFGILHTIVTVLESPDVADDRSATIHPLEHGSRGGEDWGYRREVLQAMQMMHRAIDRHWTMPMLSATVGLSPSQLTRLFHSEIGTSPMAYLTKLRVERLAYLMRHTDLGVADAASTVGLSPGNADMLFRRRWSATPSEYRRSFRPRPVRDNRLL